MALLALVGASGCTDDSAEPAPLPSETSSATAAATPSETPSASGSPAAAPSMPAGAKGTSAKSAEVFARHYVDLINYAMNTGKTEQFVELSGKTCKTCRAIALDIEALYRKSGRAEGGGWSISRSTRLVQDQGHTIYVRFGIRIRPQTVYASPGANSSSSKAGRGRLELKLSSTSGGWIVQRLGAYE